MMPKPVGLPWNHDNVSSNLIVYWMFEILYRFRCIKNGAKHFWRKIPWDEKQPFEMGMRFALDIFHVPWTFSYRCSVLFLASNQHTNRRRWKKKKGIDSNYFTVPAGVTWPYACLLLSLRWKRRTGERQKKTQHSHHPTKIAPFDILIFELLLSLS